MIGNVDTFISRHFRKQAQIKKLITACLENGRKPLILGKRLQALKVLHKHFLKLGYKSVLVIGNTKVKDDDEQDKLLQEAELIFGIDALAKEGLDVDNVDTLLTLRAMPDPEQPIGRIQRLHPDKKYPLVLYPIDGSNYYKYMFTGSKKYMIENSVVREPVKFLKALKMVEDGTEFTSITSF
jgi:superfamily II DNA or RNA helicase